MYFKFAKGDDDSSTSSSPIVGHFDAAFVEMETIDRHFIYAKTYFITSKLFTFSNIKVLFDARDI